MQKYHKFRKKQKKKYSHQEEFVRQCLLAKRDGKRITVRLPNLFDKYILKDISNLVVKLLAEEFSKQRSTFENYTEEELKESINNIN